MLPAAKTTERRDMGVGDANLCQLLGQRLAIVLGVRPRSRDGSDVGNERDFRLRQQIHEFRERPRRMADSEDWENHMQLCRSLDYIQVKRL